MQTAFRGASAEVLVMVPLRQDEITSLSPVVGEVVLRYAEFEGALDDLEEAIAAALTKNGLPRRHFPRYE